MLPPPNMHIHTGAKLVLNYGCAGVRCSGDLSGRYPIRNKTGRLAPLTAQSCESGPSCGTMRFDRYVWVLLLALFLLVLQSDLCAGDDFPSLLSTNASMAIILDREYLGPEYEKTLEETKNIVEKLIREHLKNGGLIVKYYSWTSINLKRDFSAVLSVSNCKNTWDIYQEAVRERLVMLSITDPDCPRLPSSNAIMIPRSDGSGNAFDEVSQIILDMKSSRAIGWHTATLLYDQAYDNEISRCILSLLEDREGIKPLTLTEFKINAPTHSWEKRKEIRKTLLGIPTAYTGLLSL
uniref:Ionotropic glutamate receptor L-glutamate and glycine-binding domain-containing protein n=1 Tax=Anopheles maculatus TaxID=74869 RepID=A0A182SHM6_9DIPT